MGSLGGPTGRHRPVAKVILCHYYYLWGLPAPLPWSSRRCPQTQTRAGAQDPGNVYDFNVLKLNVK